MPHHSASTGREQLLETVECKRACRPSESDGSLLEQWPIDTWSEPS
jgi:hypothetical protein